jgi:transposase
MSPLQPHKSKYWLFPNIKDWESFVVRVNLVCNLILESIQEIHPQRHVLSVDEKTSIQALERVEDRAPNSKGGGKRKEFEYIRNGIIGLMAAINVGKGNIVQQMLHPTHNEQDFATFIEMTVKVFPTEDEVVIIADQLNTHLSETLVRYVAKQINFNEELGIKGKKGILKNLESRKAFLENPDHRIRFAYTPKHCSWLNPIENWFAKLQRHIITNGSFSSVKELNDRIENYINYYNLCMVKPLKWKFKGFVKGEHLKNIKISRT